MHDNIDHLQSAVAYLRKHADNPSKKIIPFAKPVQAVKQPASEANWDVVP